MNQPLDKLTERIKQLARGPDSFLRMNDELKIMCQAIGLKKEGKITIDELQAWFSYKDQLLHFNNRGEELHKEMERLKDQLKIQKKIL